MAPARDARHLPELGVGEVAEKGELAQHLEAVRVRELLRLAGHAALGAEHLRQLARELFPARVARFALAGHGAHDDGIDLRGQPGTQHRGRRGLGVGDLVDQAEVVRRLERQPPGEQVVHHHADRIDVGAVIEALLLHLLGRHIRRRADRADLRGLAARDQRRAEIGDLHVGFAGVQQVRRLEVAVRDPEAMRELERARALEDDLHRALHRQQGVGATVLFERAAVDVLHHEVMQLLLGHRVVDLADVRVLQLAGERRLGEEQLLV